MSDYNKELEHHLLEMIRRKEEADKRLLVLEIYIGLSATVVLLLLVALAAFLPMADAVRVLLVVFGLVLFLAGCGFALRIEQVAGYYECRKCGHRYVPTYKSVNLAPHMGRTRWMKCPQCKEKSWQKKVLSKEPQ